MLAFLHCHQLPIGYYVFVETVLISKLQIQVILKLLCPCVNPNKARGGN